MQSAGLTNTRFCPPLQNLAKVPKLRYQDECPHLSSRAGGLLRPPPLRTVRATFIRQLPDSSTLKATLGIRSPGIYLCDTLM